MFIGLKGMTRWPLMTSKNFNQESKHPWAKDKGQVRFYKETCGNFNYLLCSKLVEKVSASLKN